MFKKDNKQQPMSQPQTQPTTDIFANMNPQLGNQTDKNTSTQVGQQKTSKTSKDNKTDIFNTSQKKDKIQRQHTSFGRYESVQKNQNSYNKENYNEQQKQLLQQIQNEEQQFFENTKELGIRHYPNPYPIAPTFPDSFPAELNMEPIQLEDTEKLVNASINQAMNREEQKKN